MRKKYFYGFTLVELMVVVAILALLSVGSFVYFSGYFSDTRNSTRTASLTDIETTIDAYMVVSPTAPVCASTNPNDKSQYTCDFCRQNTTDCRDGVDTTQWDKLGFTNQALDPSKKIPFVYYANGSEYQIAATMETDTSHGGSNYVIIKGTTIKGGQMVGGNIKNGDQCMVTNSDTNCLPYFHNTPLDLKCDGQSDEKACNYYRAGCKWVPGKPSKCQSK